MHAELTAILTRALRQGWRVELRSDDRLILHAPQEAGTVTIDAMPRDRRALDDVVEHMRRYGFEYP